MVLVGKGINVPELMVKGGRTYRLVKDHLGSVRLVVDTADGTIMQEMRYDAWGNVTYDSNPGFQPFGFAGGLYDPQTRLVRFGARDYDASIGRWMGKDPLVFQSWLNLYAYAKDAPQVLRDSDGLCPSHCPNYPPGCGTPPNPKCRCSPDQIYKALKNATEAIWAFRSGQAAQDGPPLKVAGSTICMGTPPDASGWIYPRCNSEPFDPHLACSGDPCVDYCSCRHEWFHYRDTRPYNIHWTLFEITRFLELPAYEEEALCLARFRAMLGSS
jgi:RHS repeat-associated protein